MYIIWSRGSDRLIFPMDYNVNETSHRHKREENTHVHSHSGSPVRTGINDGLVMTQLLRADKIVVPERYSKTS